MTEFEIKHGLSQDAPGPLEPVAVAASSVSTVEDARGERSATHGMTLGERIAHVGGRTNAQGYTEFGSPMAVNALIQHVLRDIDCTHQDDDGAYQARYRLPGGQWSSWGHVVCGVKGHEQELRYLPDGRRPAPAAGDARGAVTLITRQGRGQELFTYTSQPCDSVIAWRIGEACSKASQASAGDYIDRGLSLLKELQRKGYGIADISATQRQGDA